MAACLPHNFANHLPAQSVWHCCAGDTVQSLNGEYNLPDGVLVGINAQYGAFNITPGGPITIPCPRILSWFTGAASGFLVTTAAANVQAPAAAPGAGK